MSAFPTGQTYDTEAEAITAGEDTYDEGSNLTFELTHLVTATLTLAITAVPVETWRIRLLSAIAPPDEGVYGVTEAVKIRVRSEGDDFSLTVIPATGVTVWQSLTAVSTFEGAVSSGKGSLDHFMVVRFTDSVGNVGYLTGVVERFSFSGSDQLLMQTGMTAYILAESPAVPVLTSGIYGPDPLLTLFTTDGNHGYVTGDHVFLTGHTGFTGTWAHGEDVNGIEWEIIVISSTEFTIEFTESVGGTGGVVRKITWNVVSG